MGTLPVKRYSCISRMSDMTGTVSTALIFVMGLELFMPLLGHAANTESQQNAVNAFKALAAFPRGVSMSSTDNTGDLECMTAVRTAFSEDPPRIEYVSSIKGHNGENQTITYHIKPGPTIDTTEFTVDDDYENVMQAHFLFTNYKDCIIMELPILGTQVCVMWTKVTSSDVVPAICTEHLQDICDSAVTSYNEETCGPFGL